MLTRKLIPVFLALLAFSCADPIGDQSASSSNDVVKVIDGRLAFLNEDSYRATIDQLAVMLPDKRYEWTNGFGFASLEAAILKADNREEFLQKLGMEGLNPAHSFILNAQGLVQIGDEVVQFKNGKKYHINVDTYNADASSIQRTEKIGRYGWEADPTPETAAAGRAITAPNNGLNNGLYGNGGSQHEFQLSDGSWRKFIDVFRGSYETFGPGGACGASSATLKLWLCMEHYGRTKTSKPWSNCPDPRNLSWNISLSNVNGHYAAQCQTWATAYPISSFTNLSNSASNVTAHYYGVQVASYGQIIDLYNTPGFSWSGNCTGTVSQTSVNVPYTYTDTY